MSKLKRDGQNLSDNTRNSSEQALLQNTVASLADQLWQVKATIEDRREQISQALESWQLFLQAHASLVAWIDKTRKFLAMPLTYPNLASTKQKHADYQVNSGVHRPKNVHSIEYLQSKCTLLTSRPGSLSRVPLRNVFIPRSLLLRW